MQAAKGDFSPVRKVHVQFDELVMADGKTVALHTVASPEAGAGAASGASGFKLVGMVVGIAAHSRVVSILRNFPR